MTVANEDKPRNGNSLLEPLDKLCTALGNLDKLCTALGNVAGMAAEAHFAQQSGSSSLARDRLIAAKTSLQALSADLEWLLSALPTDTYTDLGGSTRTVEKMVWLENARYWKPSDPADDAAGEWLPCSLYSVGTDEDDGDITVWLDGNRQEVKA
jgi:hypothetical protein